jgi:[FeFe] hydrogenase H-cluster maturation GTPase HydF
MQPAPKSMRLHIGIFGRRNVGKSSLLNALTGQSSALVSSTPGTTTDPVEKPMELLPLGPVLFIDTAGVDDTGMLGVLRVERTRQVFDRTDLAIIVSADQPWGSYEKMLFDELHHRRVPVVVVFNKTDLAPPDSATVSGLMDAGLKAVAVSAATGHNIAELRRMLIATAPDSFVNTPAIVADLVTPGACVVLVVPIDKEAPKGRLILPQVQTIRDLLDNDSYCLVVKERELRAALDGLSSPPALVVTDSQAFLKVAADVPPTVRLTSFSILFARYQGDLTAMVRGAMAIETLTTGSRILVAEACTHHPITEDIATVKIPRWLTQFVGGALEFTHVRGHDFPSDLGGYNLVIHCGACMSNRREVLTRIERCHAAGVPITNYGLTIAYSLGIFARALQPFPAALALYHNAHNQG